jgi:hypothetical protein
VLNALGTIYEAKEEHFAALVSGMNILLERRRDVQVLWKLRMENGQEGRHGGVLDEILGGTIKEGRVRVKE